MKLPFEVWLDKNEQMPNEAITAFRESVTSYRGRAYRASLQFSYIGFMLTLRYRVLRTAMVSGHSERDWSNIQKGLQNDDKWDKTFFGLTQNKQRPIFSVSEDIREQVKYWKNRRNDCAHFKDNIIDANHTESLWSFIRSNLARFVPIGSHESLLQRLRDHYNPSLTPQGRLPSEIVRDLPASVPREELAAFFEQLPILLKRRIGGLTRVDSQALSQLHECMFQLNDDTVSSALLEHLLQEKNRYHRLSLFSQYPGRVQLLEDKPQFVRQMWLKNLKGKHLDVFAALLRNQMIPESEREDAIETMIEKIDNTVPDDKIIGDLTRHGFMRSFEKIVFTGERRKLGFDLDWSNNNKDTIVWFIQHQGPSSEVARVLASTFSVNENDVYPWALGKSLKKLFREPSATKQAFQELIESNDLPFPSLILEQDENS